MLTRKHYIILTCIILSMALGWQFALKTTTSPSSATGERFITIIRASYGLNCQEVQNQIPGVIRPEDSAQHPPAQGFAFQPEGTPALREDNVLVAVSTLCNGMENCTVPVNPATLGGDPAPYCSDKQLRVEYRCYAVDRLWRVTAGSRGGRNALVIDCMKNRDM